MKFTGPQSKPIHRLGYAFKSDAQGNLDINIDTLVKRTIEIDEEGKEFTTKEKVSDEEKAELLSALKCYGFEEVKAKEAVQAKETK